MQPVLFRIFGLAGVSLPSFPGVRARGKVLGRMRQSITILGLKPEKYFASRVAKLAKRQSTPASRRANWPLVRSDGGMAVRGGVA